MITRIHALTIAAISRLLSVWFYRSDCLLFPLPRNLRHALRPGPMVGAFKYGRGERLIITRCRMRRSLRRMTMLIFCILAAERAREDGLWSAALANLRAVETVSAGYGQTRERMRMFRDRHWRKRKPGFSHGEYLKVIDSPESQQIFAELGAFLLNTLNNYRKEKAA